MSDPVVTKGGDAGRLESEVAEIVFNPEVSDYEYFLSRKRYFERVKSDNAPSDPNGLKSATASGIPKTGTSVAGEGEATSLDKGAAR